jgi:hypothetical protein
MHCYGVSYVVKTNDKKTFLKIKVPEIWTRGERLLQVCLFRLLTGSNEFFGALKKSIQPSSYHLGLRFWRMVTTLSQKSLPLPTTMYHHHVQNICPIVYAWFQYYRSIWQNIPKREIYTKWPQIVQNAIKYVKMTTKYTKWPLTYVHQKAIKYLLEMTIKYLNIFHVKYLKNMNSQSGILGMVIYHLATFLCRYILWSLGTLFPFWYVVPRVTRLSEFSPNGRLFTISRCS